MTAFFNEFEPFAAQWLRNLVAAGHIAPGDVDDRSILDVRPDDLRGYDQVHLFAGIGVWSHALRCAGWPDSRPVWTASFPCQPFSTAGRRKGTEDHRHLWPVGFDLIRECRPPVILGEQVASPDGLGWWDAVQADLEGEGYACAAFDLCAPGVGAPHIRQRLYWMAYADDEGLEGRRQPGCEGAAERPARAGVLAGGLADDDREGRGLDDRRGPSSTRG
jgi:DNA (cytosine-5)-methyltransferase 1